MNIDQGKVWFRSGKYISGFATGAAILTFQSSLAAEPSLILSRDFDLILAIPEGGELLNVQSIDYGDATISDVKVDLVLSGQDGPMVNGDWYAGLGYDSQDVSSGYAVLLNRPGKTASWPFGYLDNGFDVTFADGAPDAHLYQDTTGDLEGGPLTGTWRPDGRTSLPENVVDTDMPTTALSSFNDQGASGTWQLLLSHEATGGAAELESWGLEMRLTPIAGEKLRFSTGDRIRTSDPVTALTSEITISGDVIFMASGDIVSAGALRGNGTIHQQGAGKLILTEDGDYTGALLVTKGSLQATNTSGSATGSAEIHVSQQGILSGPGRIGGKVFLFDGGTISPGSSPGAMILANDLEWGENGIYLWEINSVSGEQGTDPGWDWISVAGTLALTATAENPFVIQIVSLNSLNLPGELSGFDGLENQSWTIATAESFTGFYLNNITLDDTDFLDRNETHGGTFSWGISDKNLNIHYTAIPEPRTYALAAGIAALIIALRAKRRK